MTWLKALPVLAAGCVDGIVLSGELVSEVGHLIAPPVPSHCTFRTHCSYCTSCAISSHLLCQPFYPLRHLRTPPAPYHCLLPHHQCTPAPSLHLLLPLTLLHPLHLLRLLIALAPSCICAISLHPASSQCTSCPISLAPSHCTHLAKNGSLF